MVRIKILRYHKYDKLFTVMAEYIFRSDVISKDGEFKMDCFELGLAFYPDENHVETDADYEAMVGHEFDIEASNIKVHALAVHDARRAKRIPIGLEKWKHHPKNPCGRCGEFCECGEYITEAYEKQRDEEIRLQEEQTRVYREQQERKELLRYLAERMENRTA